MRCNSTRLPSWPRRMWIALQKETSAAKKEAVARARVEVARAEAETEAEETEEARASCSERHIPN